MVFDRLQRSKGRRWRGRRRRNGWGYVQAMLATLGVSVGALAGLAWVKNDTASAGSATFSCWVPMVTDGDTLRCGSRRVRLYGIDAPEMPGHCRPGRECTPGDPYASRSNLRSLVRWSTPQCREQDVDAYGRTVALCSVAGRDLSCAQIEGGFAVPRYGVLRC